MMKSRFALFTVLGLSLMICSCSNMLTTTMKDDKDMRSVSKSSSEYLTVKISGEEYGISEPFGEITYKVGSTNQISFTEKREYQFINWEVFDSSTNKIVKDVIRFEEPENPETKLTVLKAAENIVISPVCKIRPKVTANLPLFKAEGVYCDSVIIVDFDNQISSSSIYFTQEELISFEYESLLSDDNGVYGYVINDNIHFKNIYITSSSDENLLQYFNAPKIENNSVLKIFPKTNTDILKSAGSYLDIDVFISPEFADENGVAVGGEGVQWRYRINSSTDDVPPVFEKFTLTDAEEKLSSTFSADFLVQGNSFNPVNHVKNTLYYNCEGSDNSGNENYLVIQSTRIQTAYGEPVTEEPVLEVLSNSKSGQITLQNEDGLLEVEFTLYDMSGNASETVQKYLIAKDTFVDTSTCRIYNRNNFEMKKSYSLQDLNESVLTIYWTDVCDDVWQKDNKTSASELKYFFSWGYSPENLTRKITCTKENNFHDGKWSVKIPEFSEKQNLYIRVTIVDALGNEGYINTEIPASPSLFTYQKISDGGEYTYTDSQTGKIKTIPYPAHYRIFYSYDCVGYLFYTYEGSSEIKTQSFLDIESSEYEKKAIIPAKKYSDIYVDDISKCQFYFQCANRDGVIEPKLIDFNISLEEAYKNLKSEKNNGLLLRKIESYNPEIRNIYFFLKENGKKTEAENILNSFYLWNFILNTNQDEYYNTLLFNKPVQFSISESESLTPPSVKSISVSKGKINSGVNKAVVKYSSTAPYGVVYNLLWGTSEGAITNYETESEFNIKSGVTKLYYKTVALDTKTGESTTGSVNLYDLTSSSYDTVPPVVDNLKRTDKAQSNDGFTASDYYPVITGEICYDTYKVIDGKAKYTLYVVPETVKGMTFDQLSEDEIKTSPHLVNTFVPPASENQKTFVWNKIEGFGISGRCFYILYLEDAAGNYSYNPIKLSKVLLNQVPSITVSQKDDSRVNVNFEIEKDPDCEDYTFEYYMYNTESNICDYIVNNTDAKIVSDVVCANVPVKKDTFFFAYAKSNYSNQKKKYTKYSVPVYFYTGTQEETICELKEIIEGTNGAQIYCDRPCLVMTYWSSENYEYSIDKWESYGVQCNPMFISSVNAETGTFEDTLKYYTVDYNQIPKGQFYVIIAHFADGTALMTKNIKFN